MLYPIILLILLTNCSYCEETKGESEWYPFVISENLDPNSPANIGKLVLDPPAGKHGFVKVKDGHFYFEDGVRAKFWGTNLCFNACFLSKEQAEIIADRLAFFGFNAVRLHHMDFYFEPQGIFEDINPASNDPQSKKTTKLSEAQLSRLDYLIYQLKKHGIYVDMNLLVSRHFTTADGVIDADKLDMAAKPVSMFDPKLIELQKRYAEDLFTHYNPYTKLRYCDDPVIALIEITNENSIFDYWYSNKLNGPFIGLKEGSIPNYYVKELDKKWDRWIQQKYQAETHALRPILKFATTYPKERIEDAKNFYTDLQHNYFDDIIEFLKHKINIKVPIAGMGGYSGKNDLVSLSSCDFIDTHAYWDHPRFPNRSWDEKNFRIHNNSMLSDNNLGIIGEIENSFPNNNKPYTVTEWNHCYPNQYAYETPVLLAAYATKNNWDALFQFTFADGWEAKPVFNSISGYFDLIANTQQLILCSLGSLVYNSGDGVRTYFSKGTYKIDSPKIKGVVGIIKNRTFRFGNVMIIPATDGAVFIYSQENKPIQDSYKLMSVSIGEVKNKNSGWNNKGGFDWGEAPVLIKKTFTKIKINKKTYFSDTKSPWLEIIANPNH